MTSSNPYPAFADLIAAAGNLAPTENPRLCIASPDLPGLVKNGGIGTSFAHTTRILAAQGYDVTVIYTSAVPELDPGIRERAVAEYGAIGASFELLADHFEERELHDVVPPHPTLALSHLTYRHLRDRDFDLILFPEWQGHAYYSMHARRQGIAFADTPLCIQTHSSSLWHAINNQSTWYAANEALLFHLEREVVRMADLVVSPTHYLLDWKRDHGFRLPENTYVQPYLLDFGTEPPTEQRPAEPVDEFVFFGRLEERKGIRHFIAALNKLAATYPDATDGLTVTFLGKFTKSGNLHIVDQLLEHRDRWPFEVQMLTTLGSDDAIEYLRGPGRVGFMCSVADNSPLTVLECLYSGIPFIATDVGGIPELIASEHHKTHLVDLDPPSIAEAMARIRTEGHTVIPPRHDQADDNIPAWRDALALVPSMATRAVPEIDDPEPLVSICMTHYNREELLRKTMRGLQAQTYRNFEVIIVDDGSTDPGALAYLEQLESGAELPQCRVVHQQNRFVGAGRNLARRHANGDFIVFMDDDNFARADQLEVFVRGLLEGGYDALVCVALAFAPDSDPEDNPEIQHTFLPVASGISAGMYRNTYGDANGIFRAAALEAVGGFTEDWGLSWEDYELLARLNVEGFEVGPVPEPLLWLRSTEGSVSRRGSMLPNHYRALRPMLDHLPWETFGDAVLVGLRDSLTHHANMGRPRVGYGRFALAQALATEDGTLANLRHVAYYLARSGRAGDALDLLWDTATNDLHGRHLLFDWAATQLLTGEKHDRPPPTDDPTLLALADAMAIAADTGSTDTLVDVLRRAATEFPTEENYRLHLGVIEGFDGDRVAVETLATAFDQAEVTYLRSEPDVAAAVAEGSFPSGLSHFVRNGAREGRGWPASYWPGNLALALAGQDPEPPDDGLIARLADASDRQRRGRLQRIWRQLLATAAYPALVECSAALIRCGPVRRTLRPRPGTNPVQAIDLRKLAASKPWSRTS